MWAWDRGRGGFSTVNLLYLVYRLHALTDEVLKYAFEGTAEGEKYRRNWRRYKGKLSSFGQRNEVYGKRVSWNDRCRVIEKARECRGKSWYHNHLDFEMEHTLLIHFAFQNNGRTSSALRAIFRQKPVGKCKLRHGHIQPSGYTERSSASDIPAMLYRHMVNQKHSSRRHTGKWGCN